MEFFVQFYILFRKKIHFSFDKGRKFTFFFFQKLLKFRVSVLFTLYFFEKIGKKSNLQYDKNQYFVLDFHFSKKTLTFFFNFNDKNSFFCHILVANENNLKQTQKNEEKVLCFLS